MTQRPIDYGIERQMWTGAILSEVIAQRFEVQLKDSRIYELLEELGLSISAPIATMLMQIHKHRREWVETVNFNLRNPVSERCFFDRICRLIVEFVLWLGRTNTRKSRVMNASATS